MNSISGRFNASVCLLNQPAVKEGIKNVAGIVALAAGLVEMYDVYQICRGREISTEDYSNYPKWIQIANKVIIVCAKISLILSAGVSHSGVYVISTLVGCFFSAAQLDKAFGPNTIFAVNPWHPRHVISIAAMILALPSVVQSACKGINWVYKKIRYYKNNSIDKHDANNWLTDFKIRLITLFNTITSRPALHIGNQLCRFALHRV